MGKTSSQSLVEKDVYFVWRGGVVLTVLWDSLFTTWTEFSSSDKNAADAITDKD